MNLESGSSPFASVEDNEEIRKTSVLEVSGNAGESKVHNNGPCEVISNVYSELLSDDVNERRTGASVSVSTSPAEMKSEVSPSPTMMRKGCGLKKWRRIKRDASKVGGSSVDTGKMVMQELLNSVVQPSKRTQVHTERQQKSEGSISSMDPVVGSLDAFTLSGDPSVALGPCVDAGTYSEISEDHSSKSSTAASVPKIKYEMPLPVVVGFPHDKNRLKSLIEKNLSESLHRGQQGKGRIEAIKKARGERSKTIKENSHSSMESDSRSFNFIFMQGPYGTSNGIQSEYHGEENGNEFQGGVRQVTGGLPGGYGRENEGGYEDILPQDLIADLSLDVHKQKSENYGSSSYQDPLVEFISVLQTVQEALEKEVLKIKEISKDVPVEYLVANTQPESMDVGQNFQQTSPEQLLSGEGMQNFSQAVNSKVLEIANRDAEIELEDLLKQRIEAEIEYLAISSAVQKLSLAAVDQIASLEEHKVPVSVQTQIFDKHGYKAIMLNKEADKLGHCCKETTSSDNILKLQMRVCKFTSYFLLQLLSILVLLGVFIFKFSPNYADVVPT